MTEKKFVKHFRIYFKNGHPAYIVDKEGNKYVFHRMTHSKTSGHRNNIEIKPGVDLDNLLIKKAGGSQAIAVNNVTTSIDDGKSMTLTHKTSASSKRIKPKHKKKGKKNGKS